MSELPPLDFVYPLHDKDGFLEFVFGMWFNTTDIVGKPTADEVELTLEGFPPDRIAQVIDVLKRNNQLDEPMLPEIDL